MQNLVFHSKSYDRRGRVCEQIEHHNSHLSPASRDQKFRKMKASPFSFFRGTNHIFWSDFAGNWQINRFGGSVFSRTWLQGDAHVYNMGAYMNDREDVSYGFDDFDDSLVADYQYDVWRFAVSMVLDGLQSKRLSSDEISKGIRLFGRNYLETIAYYQQIDCFSSSFGKKNTCKLLNKFLVDTEKKLGRSKMLGKWTVVDQERRFKKIDGKLEPLAKDSDLYRQIMDSFRDYIGTVSEAFIDYYKGHYDILDIAIRQSAGTGSLGLRRYYALLRGNTDDAFDDVILDIKQQQQPTAFSYLSQEEVREYNFNFKNHAHRHLEAYSALSEYPDCHLGWLGIGDHWFSVRERSPLKNDFPTYKLKSQKDYNSMALQWSEIMATNHLQAARRLNGSLDQYVFEATINRIAKDRTKEFSKFIDRIAHAYAKEVRMDYLYFCEMY